MVNYNIIFFLLLFSCSSKEPQKITLDTQKHSIVYQKINIYAVDVHYSYNLKPNKRTTYYTVHIVNLSNDTSEFKTYQKYHIGQFWAETLVMNDNIVEIFSLDHQETIRVK